MSDIKSIQQHSSEKRLIIKCSQTRLNSGRIAQLRAILNKPLDWDFTLNVASRNGLLPILCSNLLKIFDNEISSEIRILLTNFLHEHTQKNLFLTRKLIEIVKMLEEAGIPIMPFKGTTLAMRAYGNLALRQYNDLDVLVQPKHFDEAVKVLSQKGFQPINKVNWLKRNVLFFNNKKDVGLVSEDDIVRLELHWKLSGSHFAMPVEIDELWKRLETLTLGGTDLNALPFKDLFVYLCLHGSRHAWEKFAWICDLHELILTTEECVGKIDWTGIQEHAKKLGCEKVVELGLFLVYKFYDLKTDYPDFDQIEKNQNYEKLAEQTAQRCFSDTVTSSEISDWYLYHLLLKERKTDKLKLHLRYFFWYLRIIFRPNSLDKTVFHLPSILYPLYYILRPIRLLFTYFSFNSIKKNTSD